MKQKGFTLVELVIVIVIVGILLIVAVPIYKGYVEKAKYTEAKATVATIKTAQDVYFAEHGSYYGVPGVRIQYDDVLDIDLRGNKFFRSFITADGLTHGYAIVYSDDDILRLVYEWYRPGTTAYTTTIGGITKQVPLMYSVEDGEAAFI